MNDIYLVEKNVHGAWVIYGVIGVMQFYDYSKKSAMLAYLQRCKKKIVKGV